MLTWTRGTYLVVDDDDTFRRLVVRRLRQLGFEVIDVDSVHAAQAVLDLRRVDAILSDYRMPLQDGLDLLREVRGRWPHMPFVIMTGQPDAELEQLVAELDGTAMVAKTSAIDALAQLTFVSR
jgi:DNA-binding NtrC family response regulator